MSTIRCRIMTPKGVYKEMDASIVNIETEAGQQGLAFEVCLLVGAKMARVAESWQFLDGEGHVAGDALAVLPDELEQGLAGGLADDDELGLHTRTKLLFSSGFGTGC